MLDCRGYPNPNSLRSGGSAVVPICVRDTILTLRRFAPSTLTVPLGPPWNPNGGAAGDAVPKKRIGPKNAFFYLTAVYLCWCAESYLFTMTRTRAFCFTYHSTNENPLDENIHAVRRLGLSASVTYLCYGIETCPSTGRFHLQGFVYFKNGREERVVANLLPGWYARKKYEHSTFAEAIEYCKKDQDFWETGTAPLDATAQAKKSAEVRWQLAKEGRFEELAPESIKTYEYIYQKFTNVQDRAVLDNIWIYGPSGCGKSSKVRKDYPDLYWKGMSKWWDGYNHEATVVLDDFDPKHGEFLSYYLKIWADHYAFNAEVKGGMLKIRPAVVVVTSQYTIEECFRNRDGSPDIPTIEAIRRRFKKLYWNPLYRQFADPDMPPPAPRLIRTGPSIHGVPPAENAMELDDFEFDEELFENNDF